MEAMAGENSVNSAEPGSTVDAVNEPRFAVTCPYSTSPTKQAGVRFERGELSLSWIGKVVSPEFTASDEKAPGPLPVRCLPRPRLPTPSVLSIMEFELKPSPVEDGGSVLEPVVVVRSDWVAVCGFDSWVDADMSAGEPRVFRSWLAVVVLL